MDKPIVAITMGDVCGIGPEVIAKSLIQEDIIANCHPLVIGNLAILTETARDLGISLTTKKISDVKEITDGSISVMDLENISSQDFTIGRISARAGQASVDWILKAAELLSKGFVDAMATAPINKEAVQACGYKEVGHMELLQAYSGAKDVATMLVANNLRVVHLTTHRSLARAVEYVTKQNLMDKIELTYRCFKEWGFEDPRIAVAALNPHGGEAGLLGSEEIDSIIPAVEEASSNGINITGPIPADSVFPQAVAGKYDAVVVLYHDQGHIPIKVIDFDGSVSINLGLPFTRTSVDHGTAFDIAGKGIATPDGMINSIRVAAHIAQTGHLPR